MWEREEGKHGAEPEESDAPGASASSSPGLTSSKGPQSPDGEQLAQTWRAPCAYRVPQFPPMDHLVKMDFLICKMDTAGPQISF